MKRKHRATLEEAGPLSLGQIPIELYSQVVGSLSLLSFRMLSLASKSHYDRCMSLYKKERLGQRYFQPFGGSVQKALYAAYIQDFGARALFRASGEVGSSEDGVDLGLFLLNEGYNKYSVCVTASAHFRRLVEKSGLASSRLGDRLDVPRFQDLPFEMAWMPDESLGFYVRYFDSRVSPELDSVYRADSGYSTTEYLKLALIHNDRHILYRLIPMYPNGQRECLVQYMLRTKASLTPQQCQAILEGSEAHEYGPCAQCHEDDLARGAASRYSASVNFTSVKEAVAALRQRTVEEYVMELL